MPERPTTLLSAKNLLRLYHTARHLRISQIFYQVKYKLIRPKRVTSERNLAVNHFCTSPFPRKYKTLKRDGNSLTFEFLNQQQTFNSRRIDWDCRIHGMLWAYNLNYFDWLNQIDLKKELGIELLEGYYSELNGDSIGCEPYPTSLRIVNVSKFLSTKRVDESWLTRQLENDLLTLNKRLEYHLLGNHLLENAFALYIGGLITGNKQLTRKGRRLIRRELEEQILPDGMHYERSPMYHLIILERLLDAYNFAIAAEDDLVECLKSKCFKMIAFAKNWESLSRIPLMQDSAPGVALPLPTILDYAKALLKSDYPSSATAPNESGYRLLSAGPLSLFINVGEIAPSYQPGHSHADELNFEGFYKGVPIIVDQGVSTYEPGEVREQERSTESHNCVTINGRNSSDVWASFRVGQRAQVDSIELPKCIKMKRSLRNRPGDVRRSFQITSSGVCIKDEVTCNSNSQAVGRIHFHPSIQIIPRSKTEFTILREGSALLTLSCSEGKSYDIRSFDYCVGFNRLEKAPMIVYTFSRSTTINLIHNS